MTFYRVHWSDCGEFNATNAWSSTTGRERSADGTQVECFCDGEPIDWKELDNGHVVPVMCDSCDGTGWENCSRGYSCFTEPEQLIAYMNERVGAIDDNWGQVIVFEGDRTDEDGWDGEPLVIPTGIIKTLTWSDFVAQVAA